MSEAHAYVLKVGGMNELDIVGIRKIRSECFRAGCARQRLGKGRRCSTEVMAASNLRSSKIRCPCRGAGPGSGTGSARHSRARLISSMASMRPARSVEATLTEARPRGRIRSRHIRRVTEFSGMPLERNQSAISRTSVAVGGVQMLGGGEDLDRLRAAVLEAVQQAGCSRSFTYRYVETAFCIEVLSSGIAYKKLLTRKGPERTREKFKPARRSCDSASRRDLLRAPNGTHKDMP